MYKGYEWKNILKEFRGSANPSERKIYEEYVKEKTQQLKEKYKNKYKEDLEISDKDLEEIIKADPIKRSKLLKDITNQNSKDFIDKTLKISKEMENIKKDFEKYKEATKEMEEELLKEHRRTDGEEISENDPVWEKYNQPVRDIIKKIYEAQKDLEARLNWTKEYDSLEKFFEKHQLWLNEWKTEYWEDMEYKRKKLDEKTKRLLLRMHYETIYKPLWIDIPMNPRLTMEYVNEQFLDENHSKDFDIKEDKFKKEKESNWNKVWDTILDEIAKMEGRMEWTAKTNVKDIIKEAIDSIHDPVEKKIANELRNSINKHSEWKISLADQATLFASSVKQMADYRTAYPEASPEKVFKLLNSNQNKVIHQHLRDLSTITSSDHWIKHILRWNLALAENTFNQISEESWRWLFKTQNRWKTPTDAELTQFKAKLRARTRQAIIDHDLWYTNKMNREFDLAWFLDWYHMVSDHPLRSDLWIKNNENFYIEMFGKEWYSAIRESIPWHGNAQTNRFTKIINWSASATDFVWWILSCVDCAWSPGDYKIAHLFAQPATIWELFNAYNLLESGDINWAKISLKNIIETVKNTPTSNREYQKIKDDRLKWINAFLTNKNFEAMSAKNLKKALWFHFGKFLWAFGIRTTIDSRTWKAKAWINKNNWRWIEFELAWESFELIAERFWAWTALKSLLWVCDDYWINDKWPTSNFLKSQIWKAIEDRTSGWKKQPLKNYISKRLDPKSNTYKSDLENQCLKGLLILSAYRLPL